QLAVFSDDGRHLLTAGANQVRVWKVATGEPIGRLLPHKEAVSFGALSPDGRRVVTTNNDYSAQLWRASVWDSESGKILFSLEGHPGPVSRGFFSADGRRILTYAASA